MHELIRTATVELAAFLATHLPALDEAWWETHVVDRLSFQQQRTVKERGFAELEQLDFAALLRILDQNWYELAQALALPREGRTWVRELQTVRNRWAHLSAASVAAEDLYRDADALARVLDMLGAAPASVAAVESVKRDALSDLAAPAPGFRPEARPRALQEAIRTSAASSGRPGRRKPPLHDESGLALPMFHNLALMLINLMALLKFMVQHHCCKCDVAVPAHLCSEWIISAAEVATKIDDEGDRFSEVA